MVYGVGCGEGSLRNSAGSSNEGPLLLLVVLELCKTEKSCTRGGALEVCTCIGTWRGVFLWGTCLPSERGGI